MRGLLVVTVLVLAVVLIALPPDQGGAARVYNNPQADDPGLLATAVMLVTSLRDLFDGIGDMAIRLAVNMRDVLPERMRPVFGLAVFCHNGLALIGLLTLLTLGSLRRGLQRFLG